MTQKSMFKVGDRVSHSLREVNKVGRSVGTIIHIERYMSSEGGSFRVQYDGEPPDNWKDNISWGCYLTKIRSLKLKLVTLCLQ